MFNIHIYYIYVICILHILYTVYNLSNIQCINNDDIDNNKSNSCSVIKTGRSSSSHLPGVNPSPRPSLLVNIIPLPSFVDFAKGGECSKTPHNTRDKNKGGKMLKFV